MSLVDTIETFSVKHANFRMGIDIIQGEGMSDWTRCAAECLRQLLVHPGCKKELDGKVRGSNSSKSDVSDEFSDCGHIIAFIESINNNGTSGDDLR